MTRALLFFLRGVSCLDGPSFAIPATIPAARTRAVPCCRSTIQQMQAAMADGRLTSREPSFVAKESNDKMKRDFNRWLETHGPAAPVKTLTALRHWNLGHMAAGAIRYGQSRLDIADEMDLERDRQRFDTDHEKDWRLSRTQGIDAVIETHKLDAIFTPGSSGAGLAARAGYPIVVVPFGMVPNAPTPPFPDGFEARAAPYGVGFTGKQCSEPRLIEWHTRSSKRPVVGCHPPDSRRNLVRTIERTGPRP
jgi:hypothetical protein